METPEHVIDQILASHRLGTQADGVPAEIVAALRKEGFLAEPEYHAAIREAVEHGDQPDARSRPGADRRGGPGHVQ